MAARGIPKNAGRHIASRSRQPILRACTVGNEIGDVWPSRPGAHRSIHTTWHGYGRLS